MSNSQNLKRLLQIPLEFSITNVLILLLKHADAGTSRWCWTHMLISVAIETLPFSHLNFGSKIKLHIKYCADLRKKCCCVYHY